MGLGRVGFVLGGRQSRLHDADACGAKHLRLTD